MRFVYRCAFVSAALLFACGATAATTLPVTGLGQSWPNATDVSASPYYHVYLFERGGVRYVQINDAAGTVLGAIALGGGDVLDLPIGVDADHWTSAPAGTTAVAGEPVYRDDEVAISVDPQADGTARLTVVPGECTDPSKCSVRGN